MINNLFLSVGAMKAGTTWLYEILKDHPAVAFTPEKEIHYFANKVGIENQLNHRNRILKLKSIMQHYSNANAKYIAENFKEIDWYTNYASAKDIDNDWYISLFNDLQDYICADFSNLYCQMDRDGWDNVNKVAKNVNVIYTLRDPMKRLWSHYKFHHKWIGKEDNVLDDGIELFEETLHKPWFYKNMDYASNYKKIKENVQESNFELFYFEDFRIQPQVEADKVTKFLGISSIILDSDVSNKKVNSTKDFLMPEEWQALAKLVLQSPVDDMKNIGIWHDSWEF